VNDSTLKAALIGLAILISSFLLVDCLAGSNTTELGIVQNTVYVPAKTWTTRESRTVGTGDKRHREYYTAIHHKSEEFKVWFTINGTVYSTDASETIWAQLRQDCMVHILVKHGKFTGVIWSRDVVTGCLMEH
jgi:hypothetical protein